MVPSIKYSTAAAAPLAVLCVVRGRLVVRIFMRADIDHFFSGVLEVHFSGSMQFILAI